MVKGLKIDKTILVFLVIVLLFINFSGTALAATLNFQATDSTTDTPYPNFNIVAFGAKPVGNKIDFWIQVKGTIDTHPPSGFMNAYLIEIYGKNDKESDEVVALWFNEGGNITSFVLFNRQSLSPSDYEISGGKISFYVDSEYFSNLGGGYKVVAATLHAPSSSPSSISNTYMDEAEYEYNYGGSSSNESSSGFSIAITAVIMGIIVWIVIWILIGLWVYKDAQRRGMDSPGMWFLVVAIFEIIGIILYVVLRRPMKTQEPEQPPL